MYSSCGLGGATIQGPKPRRTQEAHKQLDLRTPASQQNGQPCVGLESCRHAPYGARRLTVAAVDCTLSPLAQAVALALQCGNVHVGCCDCGCPCCLEVGRCLSTPWLQAVALCQQQLCCSGHCLRRAVPVVLNGLPQAAGLLLWDVVVTPYGSVLHFSTSALLGGIYCVLSRVSFLLVCCI